MDPAKIKAALEALKNGDADAALALLEGMIVDAAGGGEGDPPATDNALGENAEPTPPAAGEEEDAPAKLARLEKSVTDMVATIGRLSKITEGQAQAAATAELEERRELVASLVKYGAETPATAWSGKPEDRKPAEPWASVAIGVLRERVKCFSKTPVKGPTPPARAVEAGGKLVATSLGEVQLSSREIKNCEALGVKIEAYAENKAIREAAKGSK